MNIFEMFEVNKKSRAAEAKAAELNSSAKPGLAETSPEKASRYLAAVIDQQTDKLGGIRPDMFGKIEKTFGPKGKQRKAGVGRAMDRMMKPSKVDEVTGDLPFDTMLSKIVAGGNLQTLAAKIVAKIKKFPQHVENDGYERDMPRYPDGHFYGADVLNDTFGEVMQQWKKMGPDNFSDEYGEESLFDVLDGSADYTRYWDGILKLRNRLQSMPGALEQLGKMVWHGLFSGSVEQGITDIGKKGVAEAKHQPRWEVEQRTAGHHSAFYIVRGHSKPREVWKDSRGMSDFRSRAAAEAKAAELNSQEMTEDAFQTQQLIQRHADMLGRSAAQLTQGDLDQLTQLGFSIGIGAAAGVAGVIGGYELGDRFISLINKTIRMIKKKAEVDTEEIIKLQRQIVSIHKRLKTLKSEPAIAKYQAMLKQAYEVLEELEARQGNRVAEAFQDDGKMDWDAWKQKAKQHGAVKFVDTDNKTIAYDKNSKQVSSITWSSKKKGVAEGSLKEFAPVGSNDGNDGFSDDTLKLLAAQWYNGDEDPKVEQTLLAAGWEIGQDEGYDDEPGVFVVQAGDINGNSYMSWPADELRQGVAEGKGLAKKVKIVRGPDAGKTGWIREIKHGAFKGAAKSYYIDLDDGGQVNNVPGTALRLVKDSGMAEGKWNYPPEYTKKANADDEDELKVSLINKDARKEWRKKQKAKAHKDLMTGTKKEQSMSENWGEPLTGWHVVYARTGNKVSGTPNFDSRDSAQKYLMTKMSANHHNYRVAHADNLGTSAPTPMGGYLEETDNDDHGYMPTNLKLGAYRDDLNPRDYTPYPDEFKSNEHLRDIVYDMVEKGVKPKLVVVSPRRLTATQDWLADDRYRDDGSVFEEYADHPVVLTLDGEAYILDGHHRCSGALTANRKIKVYVFGSLVGVAEGEPIQELSSDALDRYKVKAKKSADDLTSQGKYRQANDRTMNVMKATGKQIDNTVTNIRNALNRGSVNQGVAEDAEQLNVGDDVIISGDVQFRGATGVIDSFGRDNRFVVVNLYNHGRHSFHSSDVSYNDYADSDDEQARMYDAGEFRGHTDDDIMESRLQEMRAAGYNIL
jgi:hypothetical protein